MKRDLDAATSQLLSLAAGLAQDCEIAIQVCDQNWAWDPEGRILMVGRSSIEEHGIQGCLGYVAHEIGHCLVTRYLDFRMPGADPETARLIMNAIEDPRAERFMMRRYPGTRTWIKAVYALDDVRMAHVQEQLLSSPRRLFVFECIREFHNNWQPTGDLPAEVASTLEQTRDARRRYAETLPDAALVPDETLRGRYAEVRPHLIAAPPTAPDEREEAVMVSAWLAFEIARNEILPAALALCTAEEHQGCQRHVGPPAPGLEFDGERRGGRRAGARPSATMERADEAAKAFGDGDGDKVIAVNYDAIRCAHDPAIERLAREIEEALQPRRRPRSGGAYPHGVRPDLRRAMRAEADPRECAHLWQRRSVPERGDLAVFVLVDLSGSMAHNGKDDAAIAGTLIVIETLARLPFVRWAAAGFQDQLVPLAAFHEGINPAVRRRVANMKLEIRGCNSGGHNQALFNDDGPAVAAATQQLLAIAAARRMMVVISDGIPEGKHSTERDLRRAISEALVAGVDIVGVGIGPGTEHVKRFYRRHLACVGVADFPQRLGALIRELLVE